MKELYSVCNMSLTIQAYSTSIVTNKLLMCWVHQAYSETRSVMITSLKVACLMLFTVNIFGYMFIYLFIYSIMADLEIRHNDLLQLQCRETTINWPTTWGSCVFYRTSPGSVQRRLVRRISANNVTSLTSSSFITSVCCNRRFLIPFTSVSYSTDIHL